MHDRYSLPCWSEPCSLFSAQKLKITYPKRKSCWPSWVLLHSCTRIWEYWLNHRPRGRQLKIFSTLRSPQVSGAPSSSSHSTRNVTDLFSGSHFPHIVYTQMTLPPLSTPSFFQAPCLFCSRTLSPPAEILFFLSCTRLVTQFCTSVISWPFLLWIFHSSKSCSFFTAVNTLPHVWYRQWYNLFAQVD